MFRYYTYFSLHRSTDVRIDIFFDPRPVIELRLHGENEGKRGSGIRFKATEVVHCGPSVTQQTKL